MRETISYGDYMILDRLAHGEHVIRGKDMHWTMKSFGLVTWANESLDITDKGRKYLKQHKRPAFPKAKTYKIEELFFDGDGI